MSYDDEAELVDQIRRLSARLAELEERVGRLEEGAPKSSAPPRPAASPAQDSSAAGDLTEALRGALQQLGEADAGAIRQQLVKNGLPSTLGRSDVNKLLYARKDLFTIARQEGNKPLWRLA